MRLDSLGLRRGCFSFLPKRVLPAALFLYFSLSRALPYCVLLVAARLLFFFASAAAAAAACQSFSFSFNSSLRSRQLVWVGCLAILLITNRLRFKLPAWVRILFQSNAHTRICVCVYASLYYLYSAGFICAHIFFLPNFHTHMSKKPRAHNKAASEKNDFNK